MSGTTTLWQAGFDAGYALQSYLTIQRNYRGPDVAAWGSGWMAGVKAARQAGHWRVIRGWSANNENQGVKHEHS